MNTVYKTEFYSRVLQIQLSACKENPEGMEPNVTTYHHQIYHRRKKILHQYVDIMWYS